MKSTSWGEYNILIGRHVCQMDSLALNE